MNYYKVLGLKSNASKIEIEEAYKKKEKYFHPDVSMEPNPEEVYNNIIKAYKTLTDERLKEIHDEQLGLSVEDVNLFFTLELDFITASVGNSSYKVIVYDEIINKDMTVYVPIHAGIESDSIIPLRNPNNVEHNYLFKVRISRDDKYRREGNDIFSSVLVNDKLLKKGGTKKINSIHGKTMLVIESNTIDNASIVLKGEGIHNETTKRIGDYYVLVISKNSLKNKKG